MNKMCLAFLGALLLALHLISTQVVQAQNSTVNMTMGNYTMMPTTMMPTTIGVNTTLKSGCGWTAASMLLLPLAVAASLLFGRS